MVPAYVIAHLTVTDADRYAPYVADFVPILNRYGGRLVMVDEDVDVLEGSPVAGRHVVLEFADRTSARAWYDSAEYQAILPHRLAGSTTHFVAIAQTATEVQEWINAQAT